MGARGATTRAPSLRPRRLQPAPWRRGAAILTGRLAEAHLSCRGLLRLAASQAQAYKRQQYTDYDANSSLSSLDSLDAFDTQFGWSSPAQPVGTAWDSVPPQQPTRTYGQGGYSYNNTRFGAAQQRATYVSNGSLDELDDDDAFGNGNQWRQPEPEPGYASGAGNDSNSASRTINGRHLSINNEIT